MVVPLLITNPEGEHSPPGVVSQGRHVDLCQDSHWKDNQSLAERLHLRPVSALHDKSPPPTSAWAQTHGSGKATSACGEANLHIIRGRQLAAMQRLAPAGALNANLTSCAAITSPSTSTLPHAKLSPRHSSNLYDARGPRLRLTCGRTSEYSGRLRKTQTTRGEGQASRKEHFNPATRRLPRRGITTRRQYAQTNSDVRRDVPAINYCNFCISPCAPPLETIQGRGGRRSQGLDFHTTIHHHPGPGNDLPLPTASTLGSGTW
jgi:hypothetical protein